MPDFRQPIDDLRRLGVPPGASPDELKSAWRRAVSQLHPDRQGGHADRDLAEVNAAFRRLQAFQAQYGRLPQASDAAPIQAVVVDTRRPRRRRATALWVATALAAALVVLWPHPGRAPESATAGPADAAAYPAAPPMDTPEARVAEPPTAFVRPAEVIDLGVSAEDVERLAGPPLFRSAERWEYGPSDVRFHDGKVSGWHSSPLRPLPVAAISASSPHTAD